MSRFLCLALVALTAAAALFLTAAPRTRHTDPPTRCTWQSFVLGGLSMSAPGFGDYPSGGDGVPPARRIRCVDFAVRGPEAPTPLPSGGLETPAELNPDSLIRGGDRQVGVNGAL